MGTAIAHAVRDDGRRDATPVRRGDAPREVAEFMATLFDARGELGQLRAAEAIAARFGDAFFSTDERGAWTIDPRVLAEFRALRPGKVWSRGQRRWQPRPAGVRGGTVD